MRVLLGAMLVCLVTTATFAEQSGAPAAPPPNPCAAAEPKQLEFWVGDWDLTWPGEKQGQIDHGTNSIHRLLDNCVVEENFSGGEAMHLRGLSVSIFDTWARKWKQTWVDNEGGYLDSVGEFKDGQMILARDAVRLDGTKEIQRMVFKNITANEFDWNWEASTDGGKTWRVMWPIHYNEEEQPIVPPQPPAGPDAQPSTAVGVAAMLR
jgi:hypothetical protein